MKRTEDDSEVEYSVPLAEFRSKIGIPEVIASVRLRGNVVCISCEKRAEK